MTWIGWDDWRAPDDYVDVATPTAVFEQEGQLVIFWVGRMLGGDRTQYVFSQKCAYNVGNAHLTPGAVSVIATLDRREKWMIADVQRADDGSYGVHAHHEETTSA